MARREAGEVLADTRRVLANATLGFSDLTGSDPGRRIAGLHNVIVWGRAVTNVLQNLRTIDQERFDAWYAPWEAEMRADPLLWYFYVWRSATLKEEGPQVHERLHVRGTLDLNKLIESMGAPPEADGFFISDDPPGSGWTVTLPDGTIEQHFADLPSSTANAEVSMQMPDPPTQHLGQPIGDPSAAHLSELYLAYLSRLVSEAESQLSNLSSASSSAGDASPQRRATSVSDKPSGNSPRRRRRNRRRA